MRDVLRLDQYHTVFSFSRQMAQVASIVRHKVAFGILPHAPVVIVVSRCLSTRPVINHGGIEQAKLWCAAFGTFSPVSIEHNSLVGEKVGNC